MEYQFNDEWTLHPVGGDTGQAFMGTHNQEKIFLKRNSSPFLAALSMEGLTPKLIWTKRTTNGDVFSAQEWMNGHLLSKQEMQSMQVIRLMHHYQHSENLYSMLKRIGGEVWSAEDFLADFKANLPEDFAQLSFVGEVLAYLSDTVQFATHAKKTVCHGDLNRKNFLLAEDDRLYLVDWEMVKIADPMVDLTQVLVQYIPMADWNRWFDQYGLTMSTEMYSRLEWYSLMNLLYLAQADFKKDRYYEFNQWIQKMKQIYTHRYYQRSNV
ncbi:MAG: phosphotransferase family protein [Aerococcus sp.]|nr:phosphotransferase family protein [Aerococcus sp.]